MYKIIFLAAFLFSFSFSAAQASSNPIELQVNASLKEEFNKPVPELYVYSAQNHCLLHSLGFATEGILSAQLDAQLLPQKQSQYLPNGQTRQEFLAQLSEKHPAIRQLPENQQQELIDAAVKSLNAAMSQQYACAGDAKDLQTQLQNMDGSPLAVDFFAQAKTVIYEYSAEWCLPCKEQEKFLQAYIAENKLDVLWLKIDRDAARTVPSGAQVTFVQQQESVKQQKSVKQQEIAEQQQSPSNSQ